MNLIIKIITVILALIFVPYFGQTENDSLLAQNKKFYTLKILKISDDYRYIIANKNYLHNRDTALVFDTQSKNPLLGQLTKKGQFSFLKSGKLLASGTTETILWDLKNGRKTKYPNARQSGSFSNNRYSYFIAEDSKIRLMDTESREQKIIENVREQKWDQDSKQLVLRLEYDGSSHFMIVGKEQKILYSTKNKVRKFDILPSAKHLIINEIDSASRSQTLVFVSLNPKTPKLKTMRLTAGQTFRVEEIQQGKAYLIVAVDQQTDSRENEMVDIWYGEDKNLEAKHYGNMSLSYWIYQPTQDKLEKIESPKFKTLINLDNERYFLAYNETELKDYNTSLPFINAYLYDLEDGTYKNWGIIYPEISVSPQGKYILYRDQNRDWVFTDITTSIKEMIGKSEMELPAFTIDNKVVYFNSSGGIWKYSIAKNTLSKIDIPSGEASVLNVSKKTIPVSHSYFYQNTTAKELLIQVRNPTTGSISLLSSDSKSLKYFIKDAQYNLNNIQANQSLRKIIFTRENLNTPPQLISRDLRNKENDLVYSSNSQDNIATSLKRELISYRGAKNQDLQGILYYPANFDHAKKYPMVVHIYEIQSNKSNKYYSPLESLWSGTNIHILQEKGYFVYLPDIDHGDKGFGFSALDCVHNALDAVRENVNIDATKVGLTGHSYGGSETNFIATHSDRFAAYVSGAGVSDIIRFHFSYNRSSYSPFYWQFESGQFRMGRSFLEDKELYFRNNPIHYVERINSPILLWAGKEDKRVETDQVMEFFIALKKYDKKVIALFYPNQAHSFPADSHAFLDISKRILDWWDYYLKDKKDINWINNQ